MESESKCPEQVISAIAQHIDMGMVCFLNTGTFEFESVLGNSYDASEDEGFREYYQEVYDKVDSWKSHIRIAPPEPWEYFKIMERFIQNCIPDGDGLKERLWGAISRRKPFRYFKSVIDESQYRQCWFDFKQNQLELFVTDYLYSQGTGTSAG